MVGALQALLRGGDFAAYRALRAEARRSDSVCLRRQREVSGLGYGSVQDASPRVPAAQGCTDGGGGVHLPEGVGGDGGGGLLRLRDAEDHLQRTERPEQKP